MRENARYAGGRIKTGAISLLDQFGGGGTSIPTDAGSVHLAQLDARVEAGVTGILRSSGLV